MLVLSLFVFQGCVKKSTYAQLEKEYDTLNSIVDSAEKRGEYWKKEYDRKKCADEKYLDEYLKESDKNDWGHEWEK